MLSDVCWRERLGRTLHRSLTVCGVDARCLLIGERLTTEEDTPDLPSRRCLKIGLILLSLTLLAGWHFSELLNQRMVWNHKTVFSVLAWATMGVLLWGRWQLGWRGRTAVRTLYVGAGVLLLA